MIHPDRSTTTASKTNLILMRVKKPNPTSEARHFCSCSPVQHSMEASTAVQHPHDLTLYRFDAGGFLIGLNSLHNKILHSVSRGVDWKFLAEYRGHDRIGDVVSGPDGIILVPGRSWPS